MRRPLFYFSCLHSPESPFAPPPFVSRLLIYRCNNDDAARQPSSTPRPSIFHSPASPYLVCQPPQPSIGAGRPYGRRRVQISAKASHQTFKEATGENSGLTRFNGRAQLASPPVQAIPALNFKPKSHCPHFQNTKANQHQPVSKPVPTCNYAHIFSVIAVLNSPENYPLDKA